MNSLTEKALNMVFVSKNIERRCKYCTKTVKKNINNEGRFKGYYRTCGTKECLQQQYLDKHINESKRKLKNPKNLTCFSCGENFTAIYSNHKRFCLECVPDKTWRNRAKLYLVGKKKWDELLILQKNKCVLCDKIPETVDHCHNSGKVRGLLCGACNMQISKMDSDKEWLKRALVYIGKGK